MGQMVIKNSPAGGGNISASCGKTPAASDAIPFCAGAGNNLIYSDRESLSRIF